MACENGVWDVRRACICVLWRPSATGTGFAQVFDACMIYGVWEPGPLRLTYLLFEMSLMLNAEVRLILVQRI
jgi:hypothetical protein